MMKRRNMQFGTVRQIQDADTNTYTLDGNTCPNCQQPTEVTSARPGMRYCTNRSCDAMVLKDL